MTTSEWLHFKYNAARTLLMMVRWLNNWSDVWSAHRKDDPVPPLSFRSGLILNHGAQDSPVSLLKEVFAERHYRKHLRLPDEGVMIDLGANIGAVTLDWAHRSPLLRIHAYEPNPSTNAMLRRNLETNQLAERVTVYDEAVGIGSGNLRLWTNGCSLSASAYGSDSPEAEATAVDVPLVDLDEVVRRTGGGPVELLKIDTEGAEADTLEGASPATLKAIRQVVLEYHIRRCPEARVRCETVLEQAGFSRLVRTINPYHGLIYAWRPEVTS